MLVNLCKSSHPHDQWTSAVTIARVSACLTSAQELAVRNILLLTRRPGDQEIKVEMWGNWVQIPVHSLTLLVGQDGHLSRVADN